MTQVLGEQWCWDGDTATCPTSYTKSYVREFRYDGARARYMNRPLNTTTYAPLTTQPTVWSDYDGDEPYGDFTVSTANPPVVSNTDAYQPGLWRKVGTASEYLHSDMLGTLRQTTGTTGAAFGSDVFTAFGERQAGSSDRFGYVGAWGYQSNPIPESLNPDTAFPFLHVGARYYDPSSGRFLQRDPIGIRGGLNVYAYARNTPSFKIDPDGTFSFVEIPNFGPPGATGQTDTGMFDPIWTKVHYAAGYLAEKLGISFAEALRLALKYEVLEPNIWPGYRENARNRWGDVFAACIGWIDAHF